MILTTSPVISRLSKLTRYQTSSDLKLLPSALRLPWHICLFSPQTLFVSSICKHSSNTHIHTHTPLVVWELDLKAVLCIYVTLKLGSRSICQRWQSWSAPPQNSWDVGAEEKIWHVLWRTGIGLFRPRLVGFFFLTPSEAMLLIMRTSQGRLEHRAAVQTGWRAAYFTLLEPSCTQVTVWPQVCAYYSLMKLKNHYHIV